MAPGPVMWEARDGKAWWNGRQLSDWVDELTRELVREFHPVEVRLFGSVARGDDAADSDVDVLVVLDDYEPEAAIDLKHRAICSVRCPVPFDVGFTDPGRLARRSRIAGTLERAATIGGRVVYRRLG